MYQLCITKNIGYTYFSESFPYRCFFCFGYMKVSPTPKILSSFYQPFNDVLSELGHFKTGQVVGIIGVPGIGKTSISRFLANVFSHNSHVLYCSFGKSKIELEQELLIKRPSDETPIFNPDKNVIRSFLTCCKPELPSHEILFKKFESNRKDVDTTTSHLVTHMDFEDVVYSGTLEIGDIKYSKNHFEIIDQVVELLNSAKIIGHYHVLIIDDLDSYKAKVREFEEWDYNYVLKSLRELAQTYEVLLVINSNIRFSRIGSDQIKPSHWNMAEGGTALADSCDKVIFIDRPSYFSDSQNLISANEFIVHLVKQHNKIIIDNQIYLRHSKDFGCLYTSESELTKTIARSNLGSKELQNQSSPILFIGSDRHLKENDESGVFNLGPVVELIDSIEQEISRLESLSKESTEINKFTEVKARLILTPCWLIPDGDEENQFKIEYLKKQILLFRFKVVVILDDIVRVALMDNDDFNAIMYLEKTDDYSDAVSYTLNPYEEQKIRFVYKPDQSSKVDMIVSAFEI